MALIGTCGVDTCVPPSVRRRWAWIERRQLFPSSCSAIAGFAFALFACNSPAGPGRTLWPSCRPAGYLELSTFWFRASESVAPPLRPSLDHQSGLRALTR
jgi:hypothetical protein